MGTYRNYGIWRGGRADRGPKAEESHTRFPWSYYKCLSSFSLKTLHNIDQLNNNHCHHPSFCRKAVCKSESKWTAVCSWLETSLFKSNEGQARTTLRAGLFLAGFLFSWISWWWLLQINILAGYIEHHTSGHTISATKAPACPPPGSEDRGRAQPPPADPVPERAGGGRVFLKTQSTPLTPLQCWSLQSRHTETLKQGENGVFHRRYFLSETNKKFLFYWCYKQKISSHPIHLTFLFVIATFPQMLSLVKSNKLNCPVAQWAFKANSSLYQGRKYGFITPVK